MKRTLLASVAAVALAAGSTVALSQGGGGGGGGAGGGGAGGGTGTMQQSPGGGGGMGGGASGGGTMQQSPGGGALKEGAPAGSAQTDRPGGARTGDQPGKQQQQQGQAPREGGSKQGASERNGAGTKQGASERDGAGTKQGASDTKQGGTTAGRSGGSSNVSLTTEQKTTIRNTVVNSGPKVTNVNFNVTVGTVVPRSVRIAPLPATLVSIEPSWRGYMYFVYNEEIVIVEPGTLRIVEVIVL